MGRSSGFIPSDGGNENVSSNANYTIATLPVCITGIDVYTGANVCNINVHDGANSNAAFFAAKVGANTSQTFDFGEPIEIRHGVWTEWDAVLNGSKVVIRYK